ncbi:MAG: M20/M25/M40 family metallo-hydrolase [Chitinophagaceae bacterium]|nr:M20/M25/M40 family metallo-hydrolase [Chitinophagaceae bacterium]
MEKIFTVLCTLYVYSLSAQTQDSLFIRRIADEVLLNGKAYENLRTLTKQIGHRLAGSPQIVKAEQWGLKTMQNAGADKTWLQECMVPHWVRGGRDMFRAERLVSSDGKINRWSTRYLDVLALGNSIGSKTAIRAQVIEVKDFNDLETKKDSVKGKIVFYNYKFNPTFIRTFLSYADAVQYRGEGPSRAAKYGAKAVVIRSMSHSSDNNPHTGSTNYVDSLPKIPALAVGLRDADWMDSTLQKTTVFATLQTNGHFLPDTIGHNVIGELRGTEFPNEYIAVGGHLDSWDVGEGAHDDGAGVVQTIEVLRVLKALNYKPRHSIRFVLFANEENGLRGGTTYAAEAKSKNEKHIFALESDAGGFTPRGFGFTLPDTQFERILSWKDLLSPYGATEFVKGGGGADIGPLNRTQGTAIGSLNPDSQRYFDVHHARSDVFEAVNKRELELGAICMAALIYLIDKYGL